MDNIKKKGKNFYFENRVKNLRQRLTISDIDTCLILKTENIYYLSGFYAKDSSSILVLSPKRIYLLVHFIFYEQAKKSCYLKDMEIIKYTSDRNEKLASILSGITARIVAIEGDYATYTDYQKFSRIIKRQGKKVRNLRNLIDELREIKDELEISLIKKSSEINDNAIRYVLNKNLNELKSLNEIDLAMEIEKTMVALGAKGRSFDLIVAGNESSSLPHYESAHKKIKEGLLLMDIGCQYNYYCSDITRSIFLGNNRGMDKFKEIYDIVLQAQVKALNYCKEGIDVKSIDRVAREYISKKGYGENFGHGLGHGIGLEVHESPKVSFTENRMLKANMVITVEPGIYIENYGGIRIEDMIIIKEEGYENLNNAPKITTFIN